MTTEANVPAAWRSRVQLGGPGAALWPFVVRNVGDPRLLRFVATGSFCGIIQLVLLQLLEMMGWNPSVANGVSYLLSAQINFLLSLRFIWRDRETPFGPGFIAQRWVKFHSSIAATGLLNMVVFAVANNFLATVFAGALGIIAAGAANFLIQDRLVFARYRTGDKASHVAAATVVAAPALPDRLLSALRTEKKLSIRSLGLHHWALLGIVALAAVLRFANLGALGYANHYYAAGVASMLKSWHNFFFVAAEPGAAVTIDKPPVGLWLQAASAYVFGINGFALLLPQIVAGILSVIVVYHLVRRWFGASAGVIAALALAVTPVVVATDRNNTMDSTLILTLLLAAWAFIKATESSKLRFLLLGVGLVGIGFNIKMLEAYLPLPGFYALYFFGARERLLLKVPKLALASVLLLVVSLSWATAVDLTPTNMRPYIGSSGNDSVINLMLGYNGMERLTGMGGRGGLLAGLFGGNRAQNRGPSGPGAFQRTPGTDGNFTPPGGATGNAPGANGLFPNSQNDGFAPSPGMNRNPRVPGGQMPGQAAASGGFLQGLTSLFGNQNQRGGFGGGFGGTGRAGALRLFTPPLSKEVSWLLPFGLLGLVLLAVRSRPRWPVSLNHQAILVWGGWLLAGATFFSVAGFFHEYYLSTLAPPLAALVGIGAVQLWRLHEEHRWLGIAPILLAGAVTLALQVLNAQAFVGFVWWLAIGAAILGLGSLLWLLATFRPMPRVAILGFACIVVALLVTPTIWSALTMLNSSDNQSLPSAYSGRPSGPANGGGVRINQTLLDLLEANTQGVKYLMAVPSAMQGADYVLATGRPVLYLGGFMGQDKVETADDLTRMVADGELRYFYWEGNGRGGQQPEISSWLTASCTSVQGFETQTQNAGAPDGTAPGSLDGGRGGFGGAMRVSLYDCGSAKP